MHFNKFVQSKPIANDVKIKNYLQSYGFSLEALQHKGFTSPRSSCTNSTSRMVFLGSSSFTSTFNHFPPGFPSHWKIWDLCQQIIVTYNNVVLVARWANDWQGRDPIAAWLWDPICRCGSGTAEGKGKGGEMEMWGTGEKRWDGMGWSRTNRNWVGYWTAVQLVSINKSLYSQYVELSKVNINFLCT